MDNFLLVPFLSKKGTLPRRQAGKNSSPKGAARSCFRCPLESDRLYS